MINIVSDAFNDYEIVTGSTKPQSSSAILYKLEDFALAPSFISRLKISYESWRALLSRLGCRLPPRISQANIYDVVAQLCVRGSLRFYKLARLESLKVFPVGKDSGICFVGGPKPLSKTYLQPLVIKNTGEAEALLAAINATDLQLTNGISSNTSITFDKKKIIQRLVSRELLAYRVPVYNNAPPKPAEEFLPVAGPRYKPVSTSSEPSPVVPIKQKPTSPQTLEEASQRLKDAKPAVDAAKAKGGPLPLSSYSLADKQAVVKNGIQEKFLVRVIESSHASDTGYIARLHDHGATIAWTAPLTMVEHGDTNAEALLKAFGTHHDANKSYTVLIIDRDKMNAMEDVQTIIPTFSNINKLIDENPQITKVPPPICKQVLCEDFAPKYYEFAKGMTANKVDTTQPERMKSFALSQGCTSKEAKMLVKRHQIAKDVAAWEEFTGNGMTLDTSVEDKIAHGPVEVLMLDKKPMQLGILKQNKIITSFAAS